MEVFYTKKSAKIMFPDYKCFRNFGDVIGRTILRRIIELGAAVCLEDLRNAPGRHEELKENRKLQLSCRLDASRRLIYEPFGNPEDYVENNSLVWRKVNVVRIIEVVDYHEKKN
ncbi:MAG: killer suppression protein HigA [Candidatus Falkowbacteria bacterium]